MLAIRKSAARGYANHGWLKSFHTFSFADYYDPDFMGFRVLRVINEDYIQGGMGFPTHGHRDMEIITFITAGALEHKDSMGNTEVIFPGEVQRMSAGTGVRHSEYNHLKDQDTALLQIWIETEKNGIPPSYEQKDFASAMATNELVLVVSRDGREGSVTAYQDFSLYAGNLAKEKKLTIPLKNNRYGWLQLIKGTMRVNDMILEKGDGLAISAESSLTVQSLDAVQFLLFDLP